MSKHTPGPWTVFYYDAGDRPHYDHNGPCPSIQAPEDQDCAVVHFDGFKQQYWSSANGNQKQIEANARLIAAAPELLEVAQTAIAFIAVWGERYRSDHGLTEVHPTHAALLAKAQAAIAKATGAS